MDDTDMLCQQLLIILEAPVFACNASLTTDSGGQCKAWALPGQTIHCKKGYRQRFSRPQPGCHLPNSPQPEIIKLFLVRERLVSDIPAGDGKIVNLFLQCSWSYFPAYFLYTCWFRPVDPDVGPDAGRVGDTQGQGRHKQVYKLIIDN